MSLTKTKNIEYQYLGQLSLLQASEMMEYLKIQVQNSPRVCILGLQHNKTITLGRRAKAEEEVNYLNEGYEVHSTSRGGLATLHDDGQLVIYPVLDVKALGLKPRVYIENLNQAVISVLKEFNINAFYDECNAGVYTDKGKISFTGVRLEKGVSSHGISFNIQNDLSRFEQIRACGIEKPRFDRLSNYAKDFEMKGIFTSWCSHFSKLL